MESVDVAPLKDIILGIGRVCDGKHLGTLVIIMTNKIHKHRNDWEQPKKKKRKNKANTAGPERGSQTRQQSILTIPANAIRGVPSVDGGYENKSEDKLNWMETNVEG